MGKKSFNNFFISGRAFLVFFLFILFLIQTDIVISAHDLNCFFYTDNVCPTGTTKLIGLENSSDGYNNAHAQNNTLDTYNNSICCNSTNTSITIENSCSGTTVVNLYNNTNSHIEIGTYNNYTNYACLNSSWQAVYCSYPTDSCPSSTDCIMSMASSEGDNTENAHIGNCSFYSQLVCCGLNNTTPTKPTLISPTNDNSVMFDRNITFDWSDSTDDESDTITYELNITCPGCPGECADVNVGSISPSTYYLSTPVCVDQSYNWSVTACDSYNACNTSSSFNFTIASVVDLVLIYNETSFGSMTINENDDTTDDNPQPFVARNNGNVLLNVSINATTLFLTEGLDNNSYQFAADENETGSYTSGCSQTTFTNMSATPKDIFCDLKYVNATDEAEVELRVTIPQNEPVGSIGSNVTLIPISTE